MRILLWQLTFVFSLCSFSVLAHDFNAGKLQIEHPWARPTAPVVTTGAVYLNIHNPSAESEKLIAVKVPENIASSVQIHQITFNQDMARMREARDGLIIPAKGELALLPKGAHIMLLGLKKQLQKGDKFIATLQFEHSGELPVEVWVEDKPNQSATEGSHH